jgi:hypothetical protein
MVIRMSQRDAHYRLVTRSGIGEFVARVFAPEIRAWRGQERLWKVFWLYGVATSSVLIAVYVFAFVVERVALRQTLVICFAPYTAWTLVSVWRCANNVREQFWGVLARFLTVAWAFNTIIILVFVEINLITHYYLRY